MLKKLLLAMLLPAGMTSVCGAGVNYGYRIDSEAKTAVLTSMTSSGFPETLYIPIQIGSAGQLYDVVGVEPGVLCGMPGVKKVIIPDNIIQLGNITATSQDVSRMPFEGAGIFLDCPDLAVIEFSGTHNVAKTTDAGLLVSLDGKDLYRVPPRLEHSSGRLKLSDNCVRIGAGAFEDNVRFSIIAFPDDLEFVSQEAGFHTMHQIQQFEQIGVNTRFGIYRNALVDYKEGVLVAYPRYCDELHYEIDMQVTPIVGDYAFANNANIRDYTMFNGMKEIGNYSFSNSMAGAMVVPASVNLDKKGIGAFEYCSFLGSLTIQGEKREIPAAFARGSRVLKTVKFPQGRPAGVGASAFKDCRSLTEFPFGGELQLRGDSIFANTGFTEVVYEVSLYSPQDRVSAATFAGCRDLRKLDFRKVSFFHAGDRMYFGKGYASGCPELAEVYFPNYVELAEESFASANSLASLLIADFMAPGKGAFTFDDYKEHTPDVYVRVPWSRQTAFSQLTGLIHYLDGTDGDANYYCAGYYPSFGSEEVVWDSRFFRPGGTGENYPAWSRDAEMFTINPTSDSEGMKVECHSLLPDVRMVSVDFDKLARQEFSPEGIAATSIQQSEVESFTVIYEVNGIEMYTMYPASVFNTMDADEISADTPGALRLAGGSVLFGTACGYTVHDLSGTRVLAGHGTEVSLSTLPQGVYVVRTSDGRVLKALI